MTDLSKIFKGAGAFIAGYLGVILLVQILPPLLEALESVFSSTDLQGIVWFFAVMLIVLAVDVIPSYFIYKGLTEESEEGDNKMAMIVTGIVIFLTMILLTWKGNFWITAFSSLAEDALIKAVYWVGVVLIWVELTIVVPYYLTIRNIITE